jgi:hypothetical protein
MIEIGEKSLVFGVSDLTVALRMINFELDQRYSGFVKKI